MTNLVKVLATLTLGFVFVSLLSFTLLYDVVDRVSYAHVQQQLIDAKEQVNETLEQRKNDDWHEISTRLSVELGIPVYVDGRNTDTFTLEQLENFGLESAKTGLIDSSSLQLYFPVSENFVLTVDGVSSNTWIAYASEGAAWFLGFLISIIVVVYFHRQDQKKLRALADVFQLNVSSANVLQREVVIEDIVELAANLVKQQQQKSQSIEQLLMTQRDLLHGVAHEFRSPLARMEFSIELLVAADQAERAKLAKQLETSIHELDELVQQLLKYSRLKHDNSPLSLSTYNLLELVNASINKVQSFYPHINYHHQDDADCSIDCDETLIVLALVNILRNAGRFAKSQCCINWHTTDDKVIIQIEDDGQGLPPGRTSDIFEPFMRLDPSRSRDSGGHGLGLAIVKAIVERHDGLISADDSELGGARFTLSFSNRLESN
ncbi:sensor histidine kinase [Thalassotalea fusca]